MSKKVVESIEIPALGHDYGKLIKGSAANCAKSGTADHYECSVCGKLFDKEKKEIETLEIPQKDHTFKHVDEVASTCAKAGTAEHYECTQCFKYFNLEKEEVTKASLSLPLAEHQYGEIDENDYFRYAICTVCGKGVRKEAVTSVEDELRCEFDQEGYDQLITNADLVIAALKDETAVLEDCVDLLDEFNEFYENLLDSYYYAHYRYTRYNTAETIDEYEEIESINNEFYDKYQKFLAAAYDSTLKDTFLCLEYFSQEELDEIEEDIEILRNEQLKELNDQIDEIQVYLNNTTTFDNEYYHKYYEQVQLRNQLAQIYGYDNYYDYGLESYGRVYSAEDVTIMRDYYNEYLAEVLSEKAEEYTTFIQSYTPSGGEKVIYDALFNGLFTDVKAMNIIADFFSLIEDEEYGVSFFDTINEAFKNGSISIGSSYEGAFCQHGAKVAYMYFQNKVGYGDSFTFVHESGHYNFSCEPALDDFDLYETHSQGNEQLFARYILNLCKQQGYTKLIKFIQLKMISDWNWTLSINTIADEFEQAMYENYYTGEKFEDGIAENEMKDLWNAVCAKYGFAYAGYFPTIISYYYSGNSVYELAYVMSLIPSIGIFAMSDEVGLEETISHYVKLYTYALDENFTAEETYVNILEYAGLYSPFNEDTYIAIKECIEKRIETVAEVDEEIYKRRGKYYFTR